MSFAKYLSLSCAQAQVEHFVAVFDGIRKLLFGTLIPSNKIRALA
jgi:hypothetical protein